MSETIITNVSSATTTNCGMVKVGNGLSVTADGTLSAKTHGNETSISTSITLAGNGSWTVTSNNTYAEIVSWFDNYDRVFASLIEGSDNIIKFGESSVELLKQSDGSIRSMPINIEYATQLSANTDELIVLMEEEGSVTIVTASKSGAPDTVTITYDGNDASHTWAEIDELYKAGKNLQVLSTEWGGDKFILPLVSVVDEGNNEYVFSAHYTDGRCAEVWFWHDPSIPDGTSQNEIGSSISDYPSASKTSLGVIKVGDGLSVTSDGTLSAEGGGSIFSGGTLNKGTLLSSVSFDCGSFNMYLVSFKLGSIAGSTICYTVNRTDLVISPTSTDTGHAIPSSTSSGAKSFTLIWFQPKSTSAQAALATLLPVQDECEEMEAEVTKLEQDWIDNPDETVAVDGNGVPMNISTKKTELEKKQAELEKLREDYFSKLGDWKNEVQE